MGSSSKMTTLDRTHSTHVQDVLFNTKKVPSALNLRDELDNWRSTYAQTFKYSDPKCFKRPFAFTQLPSIQKPSDKTVDSFKFSPGYIPKLMYCRPPGHVRNAPQALGLGCFNKIPLDSNEAMKPIQRGPKPEIKRDQAFNNDTCKLQYGTKFMTPEEAAKYQYHSLVLDNDKAGKGKVKSDREGGFYQGPKCYQKMTDSDKSKLMTILDPAVWTTSTERSHMQAAIPMSAHKGAIPNVLEKNSDNIRLRAPRYSQTTEPWQSFSECWDRVQIREADHEQAEQQKQKENQDKINQENSQDDKPKTPTKLVRHSKNRQIPGYMGYVPRLPVIKSPETLHQLNKSEPESVSNNNLRRTTSMQRDFPVYNMNNREKSPYARRRAMSTMVTLVNPNNPFRLAKGEGEIVWNIERPKCRHDFLVKK